VRPWLSTVRLGQLCGATLTRHYAMLLERGGYKGRPLSPTTVRTVHRVLSKAFGDAVPDLLEAHTGLSETDNPPCRYCWSLPYRCRAACRLTPRVRPIVPQSVPR
jgi:hypothetical protein